MRRQRIFTLDASRLDEAKLRQALDAGIPIPVSGTGLPEGAVLIQLLVERAAARPLAAIVCESEGFEDVPPDEWLPKSQAPDDLSIVPEYP